VTHPRERELILLAVVAGIFAIGYMQLGASAALPILGFLAAFAVMHVASRIWIPRADPVLLPIVAFLVAMGSMQLASIDKVQLENITGYRPLAPLQAGWLAIGTLAFVGSIWLFRSGLGPAWRVRYTLALLGIVALVSPLLPGLGHSFRGAQIWIRVGPLSFQPAEATKVLLVLFLAAYLAERRELLAMATKRLGPLRLPDARYLAPLLGVIGLAMVIFVRTTDMGPAMLLFVTFMALLWIGAGKAYYPVLGLGLFAFAVWITLRIFPHVGGRFSAWMNPFDDPQNTGFQIIQGQYGMAEGGLFGMGLSGPDSQPHLFLIGWSDLILAVTGHTLGLAGVLAIVMAFVLLLTRTFYIALRSRSDLHALATAGFAVVVGAQAVMIAGGVTRVLPLTGITLPFVSYGGSSLLANFVILGIIMAVSHNESTTQAPDTELEEAVAA
jgi:cell division protein FtsW (lipid II flippase)